MKLPTAKRELILEFQCMHCVCTSNLTRLNFRRLWDEILLESKHHIANDKALVCNSLSKSKKYNKTEHGTHKCLIGESFVLTYL